MYFVELKPAVSLAVLPSTESLKIVTFLVPRLSLSITIDREKIIMLLFSYYNAVDMGLKLEKWEIFTP